MDLEVMMINGNYSSLPALVERTGIGNAHHITPARALSIL
jgi:hypothetical protein